MHINERPLFITLPGGNMYCIKSVPDYKFHIPHKPSAGVLCVKPDRTVLYSWAIEPSTVREGGRGRGREGEKEGEMEGGGEGGRDQ